MFARENSTPYGGGLSRLLLGRRQLISAADMLRINPASTPGGNSPFPEVSAHFRCIEETPHEELHVRDNRAVSRPARLEPGRANQPDEEGLLVHVTL